MKTETTQAGQPKQDAWPRKRLVQERVLALSNAVDTSTLRCYGSPCNAYLSFVRLHDFPVEPTPDTLSFFVVYLSHYISPRSVGTSSSGIVNQLEPFYPTIREARCSRLVQYTLKGCMKLTACPVRRKRALTEQEIHYVRNHFATSPSHDDRLFLAMLSTGFLGLMRLGELTLVGDLTTRDRRRLSRRSSVTIEPDHYSFTLPSHKADRFFEGNHVIFKRSVMGSCHVTYSFSTSHLATPFSPWRCPFGSPRRKTYPVGTSFWGGYVPSSIPLSLASPSGQVVQRFWLHMAFCHPFSNMYVFPFKVSLYVY